MMLAIETVFTDPDLLDRIGERLRKDFGVTGVRVFESRNQYDYRGKDVRQKEYTLAFLVPADLPADRKAAITGCITAAIGKRWDVPAITEKSVTINPDLRMFIEGAESEGSKLRRFRRRVRKAVYATLIAIGLAGTGGGIAYNEVQSEKQKAADVKKARKEERERIYKRIFELERSIEKMANDADRKADAGKPLTVEAGEFALYFKEINEMRDLVRKLEFEARQLKDREE